MQAVQYRRHGSRSRGGAIPGQSYIDTECKSLPSELAGLLACPPDSLDDAWTAFLQRYSQLLLAVAFGFGPGYDEAMDRYAFLLDELRSDGYRRLRGFKSAGQAQFTTWLVVVSRRLCIDHHRVCYGRAGKGTNEVSRMARRKLRNADRAVEDVTALPDVSVIDAGEALEDAERGQAIRHALERLPAGDLRLLELRFQEDLPAREIAGILAMPTPFHVYRRLRSVCGILRAHLEQAGLGHGASKALQTRKDGNIS